MEGVNDPWGVTANIRRSFKNLEAIVLTLEEHARIIQPLVTDPDIAKTLLKLQNRHCPVFAREIIFIVKKMARQNVKQPLEGLRVVIEGDAKYRLVYPSELPDQLREFETRLEIIKNRLGIVEKVFDLAEEKIFAFALAAAASR